jgi:hypothetical protein
MHWYGAGEGLDFSCQPLNLAAFGQHMFALRALVDRSTHIYVGKSCTVAHRQGFDS